MRNPIELIDVRLSRKIVEADNIASFEFVRPDGSALPGFAPGAHIDVHLSGGLVRQYSLCNPAIERNRYQIAVLRDPVSRGGSEAMHVRLNEGDAVRISSPRNNFPLDPSAIHVLLMGGGIGITPMLCMADQLARTGGSFELHYCSRSPGRTAFLNALCAGAFSDKVHFHFDDGAPDQKLDIGEKLESCSIDTHLYVCGPKGFMDAVLGKARELGWSESRLHFEYFGSEIVKNSDDNEFEVELASTGTVIRVAQNQSIAAALSACGIEIPLSCEQGVCGTCLTRVISGTPDHRDMYLTAAEQERNEQMLLCCSRAKSSRLVLDL